MRDRGVKIFVLAIFMIVGVSSETYANDSVQDVDGIRAEIIIQIDSAEEKYLGLAKITPQEKFRWRPAKDVRSIGEVFMHVAFGNYLIAGVAGAEKPSDLPNEMEKISDKKLVIEHLEKSFEFARKAVINTKMSDMSDEVDFFGRKTTKRGVLYFLTIHVNQHLGQSIAYSRMNGIVPPWSSGDN